MTDSTLDVGDIPRSSADQVDPKALSTPPSHGRRDVRHHRQVGWRSRDVVRTAGLVLAIYLGLRLIWFANALFLVTFLGILFAIAVSAGVDRLERLRIPRGAGAALIVLAFFGLLIGFGAWLAPTLRSQGAELRQKLPEAVDRVEERAGRPPPPTRPEYGAPREREAPRPPLGPRAGQSLPPRPETHRPRRRALPTCSRQFSRS
jgi:hypothetical protein